MSLGSDTTQETTVHTVRRFRRASGDGLGFWPFGLLPLIGLALLTLVAWSSFAPHSIERVVRQAAEQALADEGAEWARVDVSGQWVTIKGNPPTAEVGDQLIKAVRKARVPTWLGKARPATRVRADFGAPATVLPGAASPATSAAGARQAEFLFRLSGNKLTLDGRVPDIATRDTIVAAANTDRPSRIQVVEDNLEPIGIPAPAGFSDVALRGVETLRLCDSGTASLTDLHFDLRCEVPESQAARVRELANAALAYGSVGEIEILAREAVESCEEELARLLDASRIEFDLGSDRITNSKAALLDLTARAAIDCPGRLRVEGHTDNTGSLEFNEQLSRRRAEAVRAALIQRGVAPARILAAGYGQARPIGDNETEEGRALNRRIEIRIVRPDE